MFELLFVRQRMVLALTLSLSLSLILNLNFSVAFSVFLHSLCVRHQSLGDFGIYKINDGIPFCFIPAYITYNGPLIK